MGFRPLAGITGLRTGKAGQRSREEIEGFRPLAGITGLRTRVHRQSARIDLQKFPSPCGDYGSSDWNRALVHTIRVESVSVPLRGLRVFGLTFVPPPYIRVFSPILAS